MHTRYSGRTSPLFYDPEIEKTARLNRAHYQSQMEAHTTNSSGLSHHSNPLEQHTSSQQQPNPSTEPLGNMPPPPPPIQQTPPEPYTSYGPSSSTVKPKIQFSSNPMFDRQEYDVDPLQFREPKLKQPMQFEGYEEFQPMSRTNPFNPKPVSRRSSTIDENLTFFYDESLQGRTNTRIGHVDDWDADFENNIYYEREFDDFGNQHPQFNQREQNRVNMVQGRHQGNQQGNRGQNFHAGQFVDGIPRANHRAPIQGVGSHFMPVVAENTSPIVPPHQNGRNFEVRPQYLNHLPTFYGRPTEEPYLHIAEFVSICNTMGGHGFSPDEVKLMMFQFTLKDRARSWYLTLPAGSIHTWQELQRQFLEEYYTMARTSEARDAIRSFQQQSGEPFHEAFVRFKELLRKCPHHGIPMWELIKSFYDGLLPEDVRDLISTSNGTFLTNAEHIDWEYIERLAITSKRQAHANRRNKSGAGKGLDYEAEKRIASLERQLAQLSKLGGGKEDAKVANTFNVCTLCDDLGHLAADCPTQLGRSEDVNQVFGQKQYDMNSNTYHPGLRNHPNFSYSNTNNQLNPPFQGQNQNRQTGQNNFQRGSGNQGNYNNQRNYQGGQGNWQNQGNRQTGQGPDDMAVKFDKLMEFMSDFKKEIKQEFEIRDKDHKALARQVGQLAEEVAIMRRDPGKLPSDTQVNPTHQSSSTRSVHINSVSLLSDYITPINEQEVFSQSNYKMKNLKKIFCEKHFKEIEDEKWKNFEKIKINQPLLEVIKNSPTQTENLKELSTQNRHNKLPKQFDLTAHESATLSGTIPPKLQDPGAPLIEIQIGEVKVDRALLDLGACVSILPGRMYDQHDFGPLQKVDTTVVLANQKPIRPRGMLIDVIVKVEDCYYPVDFLVLDCATTVESTQHTVILGRPFLATAHAVIDCANGTVGMKFGDRKFSLNVFANLSNSSIEEECFLVDRLEGKEEVKKGVKKKRTRKRKRKVKKQDVEDKCRKWKLHNEHLNKLDGITELIKNGLLKNEDCKHPTRPP